RLQEAPRTRSQRGLARLSRTPGSATLRRIARMERWQLMLGDVGTLLYEAVMPETPAPADSMPPLITLPLFWPVAMVAGMEKAKADLAIRNLEFVQEDLKLHGGLKP